MGEVINLSQSQYANNIITHLYNAQESHLPYKRNAPIDFTNTRFLTAFRSPNGRTNYSPRCLIYDVRLGFGTMNKYEHYEETPNYLDLPREQIISEPSYNKNEYQHNLDTGKPTRNLLNTSNTKSWSDYNKLIYNPKNLHSLTNYNDDEGVATHKNFKTLKFSYFNQGTEEYHLMDDAVDDVRRLLEQSDQFEGLNCVTDLSNAWGGFSHAYMTDVIDEYFNNGSKYNIWMYASMPQKKPDSSHMISCIKSFVELGKLSTLFFPLEAKPNSLLSDFDPSSLWHTASIPALFMDSIWNINNQSENARSMEYIESNITRGIPSLKYVNEIKINADDGLSNMVSDVDINAYYTMSMPQKETPKAIDLGLNSTAGSSDQYFSKTYIAHQPEEEWSKTPTPTNVYKLRKASNFLELDSTPDIFTFDSYNTEFNTSSAFSRTLKLYKKIISGVRLPQHMNIVEDKAELIEDLEMVLQDYLGDVSDEEDDD